MPILSIISSCNSRTSKENLYQQCTTSILSIKSEKLKNFIKEIHDDVKDKKDSSTIIVCFSKKNNHMIIRKGKLRIAKDAFRFNDFQVNGCIKYKQIFIYIFGKCPTNLFGTTQEKMYLDIFCNMRKPKIDSLIIDGKYIPPPPDGTKYLTIDGTNSWLGSYNEHDIEIMSHDFSNINMVDFFYPVH